MAAFEGYDFSFKNQQLLVLYQTNNYSGQSGECFTIVYYATSKVPVGRTTLESLFLWSPKVEKFAQNSKVFSDTKPELTQTNSNGECIILNQGSS